ncbi:hypothetical protein [Hydrogenovibrio kuenenii]|uniref:hypothetical protein n=1 Tax=Hydrogenovibrio kuenenii TaxID=63658 RepID=UPI0012FF4106|nr:hypothetical protein [Hydrogenovibrio kuenenii]
MTKRLRHYLMAFMVLFSALYSHWAMAIPLPSTSASTAQSTEVSHAAMGHQMSKDTAMNMPACHMMQMDMQQQDAPKMSYAHYCPYCHGPCHYDMDQCHVIYPVADMMTPQFDFEVPSEMPVFAIKTSLPVAPTSKHIRPPKFA